MLYRMTTSGVKLPLGHFHMWRCGGYSADDDVGSLTLPKHMVTVQNVLQGGGALDNKTMR